MRKYFTIYFLAQILFSYGQRDSISTTRAILTNDTKECQRYSIKANGFSLGYSYNGHNIFNLGVDRYRYCPGTTKTVMQLLTFNYIADSLQTYGLSFSHLKNRIFKFPIPFLLGLNYNFTTDFNRYNFDIGPQLGFAIPRTFYIPPYLHFLIVYSYRINIFNQLNYNHHYLDLKLLINFEDK